MGDLIVLSADDDEKDMAARAAARAECQARYGEGPCFNVPVRDGVEMFDCVDWCPLLRKPV